MWQEIEYLKGMSFYELIVDNGEVFTEKVARYFFK